MRCERGCVMDPDPRLGLQLAFFIEVIPPRNRSFSDALGCCVVSWASLQEREDLVALDADFIFWSNTSTSR
jgi:hypothetical protein